MIFEPGEPLPHKNYINVFLQRVQPEDEWLLNDDFISQKDLPTSHMDQKSLQWYENDLIPFVDNHWWSFSSRNLNVLDYYMWHVIANS